MRSLGRNCSDLVSLGNRRNDPLQRPSTVPHAMLIGCEDWDEMKDPAIDQLEFSSMLLLKTTENVWLEESVLQPLETVNLARNGPAEL